MKVYQRKTQKVMDEAQYQAGLLSFLYETFLGRLLLKTVITTPIFSILSSFGNQSRRSAKKIPKFIETYQIEMADYQETTYDSFNDFFIRQLKPTARTIATEPRALIAPADGRLLAYSISPDLTFMVKGQPYSIGSLLQNDELSQEYAKGLCLVLRLAVTDYHRYHYLDDGQIGEQRSIKGRLHTVSPISLGKHQVYAENSRHWSVLETTNFGKVTQVEVGALLVGRITNHPLTTFKRGQEKGYFSYGGSTIILLFKENQVTIAPDIWEWSQKGVESLLSFGEKMGECLK